MKNEVNIIVRHKAILQMIQTKLTAYACSRVLRSAQPVRAESDRQPRMWQAVIPLTSTHATRTHMSLTAAQIHRVDRCFQQQRQVDQSLHSAIPTIAACGCNSCCTQQLMSRAVSISHVLSSD